MQDLIDEQLAVWRKQEQQLASMQERVRDELATVRGAIQGALLLQGKLKEREAKADQPEPQTA